MVVTFRARGISRGTRKLARTPILNKKKKKKNLTLRKIVILCNSRLIMERTH